VNDSRYRNTIANYLSLSQRSAAVVEIGFKANAKALDVKAKEKDKGKASGYKAKAKHYGLKAKPNITATAFSSIFLLDS